LYTALKGEYQSLNTMMNQLMQGEEL